MKMQEIIQQITYLSGEPAVDNVEELDPRQAVLIAFQELKRYIRTPVNKTIPYQRRIDLKAVGIYCTKILYVQAAYPRIGLTLNTIDSGNVFQVAAAVNTYSAIGQTSSLNIDPIMTEMAMAQVRNTLSTDFQWTYDQPNDCLYVAHRDPIPTMVTVRYVPDFQDVSEITDPSWINYLVRMSLANYKIALGQARSKYTIEGSNVSLNGEALLSEANAELETIRSELDSKKRKLVVLN